MQGKKGACEVATCVWKYLTEAHAQGKKSIHLFCDRCAGQSNNRMVYIMLAVATFEFDVFVSGHSQNEH